MSFFKKAKETDELNNAEKYADAETECVSSDEGSFNDLKEEAADSQKYTSIHKTTLTEENSKDALFEEISSYLSDYASGPESNLMTELIRDAISVDDFMERIEEELLRYESLREIDLTEEEEKKIVSNFRKKQFGYDILEDYLNDDTISDIKILGPNLIRIKREGKRLSSPKHFKNKEDYLNFAAKVALKNEINTGLNNAIQVFTDKTSCDSAILRINYTSGLINSSGMPGICFRKILKNKRSLKDLCEKYHMMEPRVYEYLRKQVTESTGILLTGQGASGKTTLINGMLDIIPLDKSGLVIQESEELFTNHPDIMCQHILTTNGDGKINYTLGDLAVNGLLMDIDYFVIGEIKGAEAAKFMTASYTGTKCWASVHGSSSEDALNKLADYVKWATDYSLTDIYHMLRFMRTIIFMKDYKVWEISEVEGVKSDGKLKYRPIVREGKWVAD